MVSHVPLAVFVMLYPSIDPANPSTDVPLAVNATIRLADYKAAMDHAFPAVMERFAQDNVRARQQRIVDASYSFVARVLEDNHLSLRSLQSFVRPLRDDINANVMAAAVGQIDGCAGAVACCALPWLAASGRAFHHALLCRCHAVLIVSAQLARRDDGLETQPAVRSRVGRTACRCYLQPHGAPTESGVAGASAH